MKKLKIVVLMVLLLGGLLLILGYNNFIIYSTVTIEDDISTYKEINRFNINSKNISYIDINWGYDNGKVIVKSYDGDEIEIIEYAQRELNRDELLHQEIKENILSIKFNELEPQATGFLVSKLSIPVKKVEILIPAGISEKLENIKIDMLGSDLFISEIYAKKLNIEIHSGKVQLVNLQCNELLAKAVSGDILFTESKADSVLLQTSSGEVTLDGEMESLEIKSSSGYVNISDKIVPDLIDIKTRDGSIRLRLPQVEQISLDYETKSGKFACDFPVVVNEGKEIYTFETIDGDIEITSFK